MMLTMTSDNTIIIWIVLSYCFDSFPLYVGKNVTSSNINGTISISDNHHQSNLPASANIDSNNITNTTQTNYSQNQSIDNIQSEESILSSKIMSLIRFPSTSSPNTTTDSRRTNNHTDSSSSLNEAIDFRRLLSKKIQPRINPLLPLEILLRILLLPLRILLAPVIVLLRALIEVLRLLLRLLNPIFLIFAFLGAVNMVANVARIIELILREILESLRRRERKEKDESREVEVITIVEEPTTERPRIYYSKPKPKSKSKFKPKSIKKNNHHQNHHQHHQQIARPKKNPRVDSHHQQQQHIDDIFERERSIISKLTCLGALTHYPVNQTVPSNQQWIMLDPYIEAQCGFNALPNPHYMITG